MATLHVPMFGARMARGCVRPTGQRQSLLPPGREARPMLPGRGSPATAACSRKTSGFTCEFASGGRQGRAPAWPLRSGPGPPAALPSKSRTRGQPGLAVGPRLVLPARRRPQEPPSAPERAAKVDPCSQGPCRHEGSPLKPQFLYRAHVAQRQREPLASTRHGLRQAPKTPLPC